MITLDTFIGNTELIQLLKIEILAARARNTELPHVLLKGPAGCGKTSLGEVIARAFGSELLTLTPNTAKRGELLRKFFLGMSDRGYTPEGEITGKIEPSIVFIDEVHQLSMVAQELLGVAMHDWRIPVRVEGKDCFEWVPRFTLIGATTLPGKLSKPFRDRFKIQAQFETYSLQESLDIVDLHAQKEGLRLERGVAESIANRSRGVGRLIVRFLDRLAAAAVVASQGNPKSKNLISTMLAEKMFADFLQVDDRGLTRVDVKILKELYSAEDPVGLDTLSTIVNEDKSTVEGEVEPYLVQQGLVSRTKRGRIITEGGRKYLRDAGYVGKDTSTTRVGRIMGVLDT
jgi:Holliday junction DNA helicase RuvB